MQTRNRLAKSLIAAGLVILVGLGIARAYAAAHHPLGSFDDYGGWLAIPLIGTLSLVGGIFLLALSGGDKQG